jgi:hypothetical protein
MCFIMKSYLSIVTPSPSVHHIHNILPSSHWILQPQTHPSPSPHPNAGAIAYPTTNSSPCLKHYHNHTSVYTSSPRIPLSKLTVHKFPTPSSSAGAKTLPT